MLLYNRNTFLSISAEVQDSIHSSYHFALVGVRISLLRGKGGLIFDVEKQNTLKTTLLNTLFIKKIFPKKFQTSI